VSTGPPLTRRRIVFVLVAIGVVVAIVLMGAAFLPRWWAQRIGDQVRGDLAEDSTFDLFAAGTTLGLFYGFVFTLVPLLVLWVGWKLFHSWNLRIAVVLVAAVLAAPNLLTLGIVLGSGSGAHAGDRILDVEAPFFRGASLIGALAAALLVGGAWYLLEGRRWLRRERRGP
jgi:hypothetical protein